MFCSMCRDHAHRYPGDTVQHITFIDGTPPTKIDRIKSQETSKYHLIALEKAKKKTAAVRESVAAREDLRRVAGQQKGPEQGDDSKYLSI